MKKVLSVLLAAAMVMGMSVSAFAISFTGDVNTKSDTSGFTSFGNSTSENCYHGEEGTKAIEHLDVSKVYFADYLYVNKDFGTPYGDPKTGKYTSLEKAVLNPGDDLYFVVCGVNDQGVNTQVNWGKDTWEKHWNINIKANVYVDDAYFVTADNGVLMVKVELDDELDTIDAQEVKLQMYIAENYKGEKNQSHGVSLELPFDNKVEKYVDFDYTNDVDYAAKWIVKKNTKGTAVFDFEDAAYFTVKMIPEEEVVLNFSQAYDKDIDKAYNEYDAELEFYNFKGESDEFSKVGELFIPADKDSFIYEIVDGEVVEVEAEYVKGYKVDGFSAKNGWVIKTSELGYYVVADDELVVAEEENKENTNNSGNKTNPETGANDFVGAAVALAVVSVAAAGALAFKK